MKTTEKIYNDYSIRDMLRRMPEGLRKFKRHRNLYIQNCLEVYECESKGFNLSYAQCIRNSNFNLLKTYL